MNKIIFFSFCVLVCSAQSVFGEKLNEQGIQLVRELAESLGNIQEYIAGGARSLPLGDGQLNAISDNIEQLTVKLQGSDAVQNLNNPGRNGRSLNGVFQLNMQLQSLADSLKN